MSQFLAQVGQRQSAQRSSTLECSGSTGMALKVGHAAGLQRGRLSLLERRGGTGSDGVTLSTSDVLADGGNAVFSQ